MENSVVPFFENIRIYVRHSDGYINGTKMCSVVGKSFSNWFQSQKTREFLYRLYKNLDTHVDLIIDSGKYVYIHPLLVIHICQWLSPLFEIEMTKWICRLMMVGKLDYKTLTFDDIQKDIKHCTKFLNFMVDDTESDVFFYVYSTHKYKFQYFIGTTNDINETIQQVKNIYKNVNIDILIYSKYVINIIKSVHAIYENSVDNKLQYNIITEDIQCITKKVQDICKLLQIEYYTCTLDELKKYNTMLKNGDDLLFTLLKGCMQPSTHVVDNKWPTPLNHRPKPYIEYDENGNVVRKKCSRCQKNKLANEFYKKKGKPGNLSSECVSCRYNIQYSNEPVVQKRCSKCEQVKDVDQFYTSRVSVDRYEHMCKHCRFGTK
jgi:KilA-N domain